MDNNLLPIIILLVVGGAAALIVSFIDKGNLNNIKSRKVGDGQHGTSRWASEKEVAQQLSVLPFLPDQWRKGECLPTTPGTIVGFIGNNKNPKARIDPTDSHSLVISTPGGGKTTFFMYPNIEYACACGLSFLSTDTKGDVFRDYAGISEKHYGYNPYVIDLRNPAKSHGYNMLHLINKYMDLYKSTGNISYKARAEKYAKITAKTIVFTKGFSDGGQNAFFYDAAEGVIAAVILLVAELCQPNERHIVSVFKLVQELLEFDPETVPQNKQETEVKKPKRYFEQLMATLPSEHKAKWLAGSALNSPGQSMTSVMSTAMSRLLSFIDTDLEQIICFNSDVDAERFCSNKTSVFIVFPENDAPKHFLVSLFVKQLYDECLEISGEQNNRLERRVYFFLDEYGTIPRFENAEGMFSAGRSRNIIQIPMIQSFSQLNKNYGKDGADTIKECCQNVLFGSLPPISKTAEELSRALGNQTVMSGSISKNAVKSSSSTSYQMMGRPLMTPDEIKNLPQGKWILNKTGMYPMKTEVKRYNQVGIELDEPFTINEKSNRTVYYASRLALMEAAKSKYGSNCPTENTDFCETKKSLSPEFLN